jgi:hypothetical protein
MATARILDQGAFTAQNITISGTGLATPQAVPIANGQQVTFTNSSGSPINIVFVADPAHTGVSVFNNVSGLSPTAPNNTNTQTPQVNDRTVNYNVVIGGNTYGPYAIQVGSGPIYISVTGSNTTPDPVVIPTNGWVEFFATDTNYTVTWQASTGDPFYPPITSIAVGVGNNSPHQAKLAPNSFPYTLRVGLADGNGGGTVKVRGT